MAIEDFNAKIQEVVKNLPEKPGVYQYFNNNGKIIYVGKAKNLKKRVSSYFNKAHEPGKTRVLVNKIDRIKYIVVNSEEDALLLENSLIKQFQPRYNVLLKDDKTYPSICITKEPFPRVFSTRKINKQGGKYFGPYSHLPTMKALLSLVKKIYKIRTCRLNLEQEAIKEGKFKVCLQYHIDRCMGPCIGEQSLEDYNENIDEVEQILKGRTQEIVSRLKEKMLLLAKELRFEEAQAVKDKLELIENFRAKSEVVSNTIDNIDVFSIVDNGSKSSYINYLHISSGAINKAFTFEYKKKLNETQEELLTLGVIEMRRRHNSKAKEIILPFELDIELKEVKQTVPQRGEKRKLLDLSLLNVQQYKADRLKQAERLNPEQRRVKLLKEIQEMLKLETPPMHIECFDNSNIQGSAPVAGCIVFRQGRPSKKEYRKYHIKSVDGPDDYASLREVVYRRYHKMMESKESLPDLIITDGGKGQMSSVKEVLDSLNLQIPIAGLAKDDKHKTSELLYGSPPLTIGLKQGTPLFHLLEQIQDEVHRYAISFHRDIRSKKQIASELDNIKGIGPKTKQLLLTHFKSIKRIREASNKEIIELIGPAKGELIIKELKHENSNSKS